MYHDSGREVRTNGKEKKKAGAVLKRWLLQGQEKQRDGSEAASWKNLVGGREEETQVRDTGQLTKGKEIKKDEGETEEVVSVKELIVKIEK